VTRKREVCHRKRYGGFMRWRVIGGFVALSTVGGFAAPSGADGPTLQDASHRARSMMLELRRGSMTVAELNSRIPPNDPVWTQDIVWDVEALGWIAPTGAPRTYGLTDRGRRVLRVRSRHGVDQPHVAGGEGLQR